MSGDEIPAVGPSGRRYPSWDAMLAEESNGHAVVAVLRNVRTDQIWSYVLGPFGTKREAVNARQRLRSRFRREAAANPEVQLMVISIRPAWKEV